MVLDYLAGNDSLRNILIESHIGLALFYASKAAAKCPRMKEELLSTALYELTAGVEKFKEAGRDEKITPYLACRIRYALLHEFAPTGDIGIVTTRHALRGKTMTRVTLEDSPIEHYFGLDVQELLETVCSPSELAMVEMELAGYKRIEIAARFDISPGTVTTRMNLIYDKLREIWRT